MYSLLKSMVPPVVCFLNVVGTKQQPHFYHHLQKSQLSLPWSPGPFASQTRTPSGPWLYSSHLASHYGGPMAMPLTCMSYLPPMLLTRDTWGHMKLSPPSTNHGNQLAWEVGNVLGPWSHHLVTKSSLPYSSGCLWVWSKGFY